jgi:hypothetical protein
MLSMEPTSPFFIFSQQKTIDQKVDALLMQMTLEKKGGNCSV